MLFLVLLFLYMVSLMFMKWIWYGPKNRTCTLNHFFTMNIIFKCKLFIVIIIALKTSPRCAPSVLIIFINMMLNKHTKPFDGCDEYMFEGQVKTSMSIDLNENIMIIFFLFILGSFAKDICCDCYVVYSSDVVR